MRGTGARYEAILALFELTKRRLGYAERPPGELEALRPRGQRPARPVQGTLFDDVPAQRGR